MNPFKTSTNQGKSSKKKRQLSSSSSESSNLSSESSSVVVTRAKGQVRKPVSQKEISTKTSTTRIDTGNLPSKTASQQSVSNPISERIASTIEKLRHASGDVSKKSRPQTSKYSPNNSPGSGSLHTTSLRPTSSSPIQRKVSAVRRMFENVSTPSSLVVARMPTRGEAVTKVKDIIKQLTVLTDSTSEASSSQEKVDEQGIPDISSEDELCAALKALYISKDIKSKGFKRIKERELPKKKVNPVADIYIKEELVSDSETLLVSDESDRQISLPELYKPGDLLVENSEILLPCSSLEYPTKFTISAPELPKKTYLAPKCSPTSGDDKALKLSKKKNDKPSEEISMNIKSPKALYSASLPELTLVIPDLEPAERAKTGLDSTATNYIDLSSYVTSKPRHIKSASPGLDLAKVSSRSCIDFSSASGDFALGHVVDLTFACLTDDEKSSVSRMFQGSEPRRQRIGNDTSEPTSEQIPQHLQDMFKKYGAIPKRAFASKLTIPKSKPTMQNKEIPLRRLKSFPLEKIPEAREVSNYNYRSLTEPDLIGKKKPVSCSEIIEQIIEEFPEGISHTSSSQEIIVEKPTNSKKSKKKSSKVKEEDIPGVFKYYPVLPDFCIKRAVPEVQYDIACGGTDIPDLPPEIDIPRRMCATPQSESDAQLKSKADEASYNLIDPETIPIPSTSENGENNSPQYIPKYTFKSPQSGNLYAIEEWGEEDDLPDLSLIEDGRPQQKSRPPRNDDGLDAIFGPLEDDDYYEEDYEEDLEEEEDPYEDTETSLGQGGGADSPDLEFIFDDSDSHGNEIAELYSYTEQPELQLNVRAFEDQMEIYELPPSWQRLSIENRRSVVMKLLDQLECSRKPVRMRSARCLLYIAQGCWAEVQSDTEQQHWTRLNALLLFKLGVFSAFTDLLNIEIDNSTAAHVAMRKIAVSLADSQDLRVILSVLYIITEVIRNEKMCDDSEYKCEIEAFVFEIGHAHGDDHLVIKLLSMVTRFCSGAAPHFPMKKVLLLLWKLILVSLGGMNTLKELKAAKRMRANLPPQDEDTMEIAKTMRSSSPPASASDLLEAQNQKRSTRPFRRSLMKQSSLDDQESLGMEMETSMGNENGDDIADMTEFDERRPTDNSEANQMFNNHILNMYNMQVSPPPQHDIIPRGLPWKPKVRQKDIDAFMDTARQKFLGYSLPGDQTTLFGLPEPIHEGVRILKEHVYTSLAEMQIQKEEEIARNPVSTKEEDIELTPAEILYQAMLPNLPQYMIALLKILLAAAPTSKAKTDSINIMADVLPEEMPMTVLQSMKLGIDVNRHKEIIVKAVSAILLLLLKHFKLNHIYQFEFMSQHLVFANCIPLVLKFFNQNIMGYIGAKNVIPILDFPSCVIGDQPELTAESLEIGDAATFSWRNMFSCINLLRILNKLTKWKHSRIMMLVVFKSAPILKRTLKIRHAMTQLYVLKLLKMQTKYLGRQWRKSNMKTISAIYQKVRHRLNDDWAYGNDLDARPWDFQAEECALRASVDRFNNRRYTPYSDSEFEPVDNNPSSVLGQPHELSESFKRHYDLWLEQEVHGTPIDWEKLLLESDTDTDKNKNKDDKPEDKQ